MSTIIVSDIHLGSRHSRPGLFMRFLEELQPDDRLVLNGDVVNYWRGELEGGDRDALQRLRDESRRREVIWVRGNHDDRFETEDPAAIRFMNSFNLGKRLYVAHGYDFDTVMPYHRTFIVLFRWFHRLRIRLGAESVHVAYYAKKYHLLYGVLRKHVSMNAVEYARENGYAAVTCGHTHYAEDRMIEGIRYINTGAWTEEPIYGLCIEADTMELRCIAPRCGDAPNGDRVCI